MAQGKIAWKETFKGAAAFVIPAVALIGITMGAIAFANSGRAKRNPYGDVSQGGDLTAGRIAVGDCYQDPTTTLPIDSVPAVPCDKPHTAQVYGVFAYPNATVKVPRQAEMDAVIGPRCQTARDAAVDEGKVPNDASTSALIPESSSWISGRHDILCTITGSTPWTGSVLK